MWFNFRHDVYNHGSDSAVVQTLSKIQSTLSALVKKVNEMAVKLDELVAAVERQTTVVNSTKVLLGQLSQMVKDAGVDPVELARVTDLLDGNTKALSDAVVANTPTEDEPVEQEPVPE